MAERGTAPKPSGRLKMLRPTRGHHPFIRPLGMCKVWRLTPTASSTHETAPRGLDEVLQREFITGIRVAQFSVMMSLEDFWLTWTEWPWQTDEQQIRRRVGRREGQWSVRSPSIWPTRPWTGPWSRNSNCTTGRGVGFHMTVLPGQSQENLPNPPSAHLYSAGEGCRIFPFLPLPAVGQ
jgi:hypothetical protein